MSNYDWTKPRIRKRNLFIVEGNHEKNIFIKLILQSYPEMEIDWNDIIIYGTNIYSLYDTIVETYGRNWNDIDVDLTYIVREKTDSNESWTYDDFINIILIFDYERHAPCFSEEKITKMQSYFQDSAYVGKLYLNYPMLESYQHFFCIPDLGYCDRRVSVSLQPGRKYKNIVKRTFIARLVNLPEKMTQILGQRFGLSDQNKCTECVEKMLRINAAEIDLEKQIEQILVCVLDKKDLLMP